MENLCNSGGGWMRVAHLNMTDSNEKCPEQFRLYSSGGVRACGRPVSSGGSCPGIKFPSFDFEYSQVCGKVIGYQVGSTDAGYYDNDNIESWYVDGVSITHGSPRKHIWTFVAGLTDGTTNNRCPCGSNPQSLPGFVGNDHYCESGNHDSYFINSRFYNTDRLWDGEECGKDETLCCQRSLIPWFLKSLGYSTTDYIEMRICLQESTSNEDIAVEQYVIYVK
jgi:hypothetical protein